ncbi:MAG: conserved hypothetical protein [Marine Group I thaumarchaeote]|nr:MAG: conserved hypothetical protein [Marine Group I thaumarchaeote]
MVSMRALCLVTVKAAKLDKVLLNLKKKRKAIREIMPVTGRADIIIVLQGTIDDINYSVFEFKKIKEIVSTETLIEVEVNMGW